MIGAVMILLGALAADTTANPDPYDPGVILEDAERTPPRQPGMPGTPNPVSDVPTAHVPEPLVCRAEGAFPNTDDCIMPTDPVETDAPTVTPGDVEHAVKRIGLPRLTTQIQPPGTTLVNLDTIFHTSADPFERTVPILDSIVLLRATPSSYTWHHGDGTSQTTNTPGRPYPAMDVTHQYSRPGRTSASVDVTYAVTYRIDDGEWQDLDTPITASGPVTTLRIREARPVLTR